MDVKIPQDVGIRGVKRNGIGQPSELMIQEAALILVQPLIGKR